MESCQQSVANVTQVSPEAPYYVKGLVLGLSAYRTAYFTLLGLNVTVLAITFKFLRPWMKNLAVIYRWLPPVMFLAFLPVAAALLQGQDSILLLTLLAASLVSLHSGRELAA